MSDPNVNNQTQTNSASDPAANFNDYLQQWEDAKKKALQDQLALASAIQQMMAMLHSGNAFGAMMMAQMMVMPAAMQTQGDQMAILGATENLATGVRAFITDLQSLYNEGGNMSKDDATKFSHELAELKAILAGGVNDSQDGGNSWLNPDDKANMLQAIQTMEGQFGGEQKGGMLTPTVIQSDMIAWFKTDQTTNERAKSSAAQTAIQGSCQTLNNSISAQASSTVAAEQYQSNIYNQLTGLVTNMFQGTAALLKASIQNEKS